ncbi:DMT family transporter [Sphingopyxis kveilinensis]|uniref:DMT family transporter n=1 Tax=Sphingopyxis kveilinensis TaxID=3114367 RepID=UPI0030D33A22
MALNPLTLGVIILSVLMNAAAQLALSVALKGTTMFDTSAPLKSAMTLAFNPGIILALFIYGLSVLLWMYVLSKADVSLAYPFLGLGFVFVAIISYLFMSEPLNAQKLIGILTVATGIVILARS